MPALFTRLSRAEFLKVFKRGRRASSPSFQFIYSANERDFKLAVVVSKKVARSAVGRNALRRRTYHAMREAVTTLKIEGGACVVIVLPHIHKQTYEELVAECAAVLAHAFGRPSISR